MCVHELGEGMHLTCTEIFSQLKMRHVIIIAINFCTTVVSNYICQCVCVCVCVCVCLEKWGEGDGKHNLSGFFEKEARIRWWLDDYSCVIRFFWEGSKNKMMVRWLFLWIFERVLAENSLWSHMIHQFLIFLAVLLGLWNLSFSITKDQTLVVLTTGSQGKCPATAP